MPSTAAPVVVTGANGLVGSRTCEDWSGEVRVCGRSFDAAARLLCSRGSWRWSATSQIPTSPPGPTSVWNTLRPAAMRDDERARHAIAEQTFPWVHVADLASLAADLACGRVPDAADPASGPVSRACISLNVAAARATQRDYFEAVSGALGVDPAWEEVPSWTGRLLTDLAHDWGWIPTVDLVQALAEIVTGLSFRL